MHDIDKQIFYVLNYVICVVGYKRLKEGTE